MDQKAPVESVHGRSAVFCTQGTLDDLHRALPAELGNAKNVIEDGVFQLNNGVRVFGHASALVGAPNRKLVRMSAAEAC